MSLSQFRIQFTPVNALELRVYDTLLFCQRILQSGDKIDHFDKWSELYQQDMARPSFVRRGPLIIGTELLLPSPLNYSILVRPPPAQSPHTVLMDILIGFGHII